MRFAFSTNAYLHHPFADACRHLAGIGYTAVEIMADVPHAWPACLLPEQKAELRRALDANGLQISNVNAFMMNAISDPRQKYWHPSWIEPDRHYRQIRIDHTVRALSLAAELGAPCLTTEPGGPLEPGQSWAAALDLFVEMLKPVADHAEKVRVPLLIEPEPGLLLETTEQALAFIDRFPSPWVGLNFDAGHMYCVGEDPATALKQLAPHVRHIHLEDIAASRVHQHLIPGTGAIDFPALFQAIHDIGYEGWLTVELYPYVENPDVAAQNALAYLRQIAHNTASS